MAVTGEEMLESVGIRSVRDSKRSDSKKKAGGSGKKQAGRAPVTWITRQPLKTSSSRRHDIHIPGTNIRHTAYRKRAAQARYDPREIRGPGGTDYELPAGYAGLTKGGEKVAQQVGSLHKEVSQRVIASGGVEAGVMLAGGFGAAWWVATRQADIYWALGTVAVSFFVAGGARNNAGIRDVSLGAMVGAATVLALNLTGKMNLASGQQGF